MDSAWEVELAPGACSNSSLKSSSGMEPPQVLALEMSTGVDRRRLPASNPTLRGASSHCRGNPTKGRREGKKQEGRKAVRKEGRQEGWLIMFHAYSAISSVFIYFRLVLMIFHRFSSCAPPFS